MGKWVYFRSDRSPWTTQYNSIHLLRRLYGIDNSATTVNRLWQNIISFEVGALKRKKYQPRRPWTFIHFFLIWYNCCTYLHSIRTSQNIYAPPPHTTHSPSYHSYRCIGCIGIDGNYFSLYFYAFLGMRSFNTRCEYPKSTS